MSNQPLHSRKEALEDTVGLYRCDRCYRKRLIEEFVEDESMPGMLVCPTCFERQDFEADKAENPRTEKVEHYFR